MNYIDTLGFYHDAPVAEDGYNSSDNGLYYTAIACKLGLLKELSHAQMITLYNCAASRMRLNFNPSRQDIPFSRDEVLGVVELGFGSKLLGSGWNYSPAPLPKFSFLQFIVQAIHLIDPHTLKLKHRTTFWKEGYGQIGYVAYMVPFQDRYYIAKKMGRSTNPIYWLIHVIAHRRKIEDRSRRLLSWFKTGKDIEAVANYFPKDHPFQDYV
jgi:hypothetical protein